MSTIQYTEDNLEELVLFLTNLTVGETVSTIDSEKIRNKYTVIFKNADNILLNNILMNKDKSKLPLNLPFGTLGNIIKQGTIFTIESEELTSDSSGDDSYYSESDESEFDEAIDEEYVEEDSSEMIFTALVSNIEEDVLNRREGLSKWEQKLGENENRDLIIELLNEIYQHKRDPDSVYTESELYLKLQNSNNTIITEDFRPFLTKILDNKYNETNIIPIVADLKKYYNIIPGRNEENEEKEESMKKFIELDLVGQELDTDDEDKEYGELFILLEMIKQYSQKSKQIDSDFNFQNYMGKRYNGGEIKYLDNQDEKTITFNPLELDYLPMEEEDIGRAFYKTVVNNSINVMRNCYDESDDTFCISNPSTSTDADLNKLSFITRKTTKADYLLKDVTDNIYISSSKHKIKTCNGTNKTGDMFYYGTDKMSDFNKIQSKPPKKIPLFDGEELNIIGLYVQSPYKIRPNVIGGTEYTNPDDNSKHYNNLISKSHNISSLLKVNIEVDSEIVIVNNYSDFSYNKYDPYKDYFIIFNNSSGSIGKDTFNEYLKTLLPNINNIFDIEKDNLSKCISIKEIEEVINKYGIYFKELPYSSINKIRKNITKNIVKLNTKHNQNKLIYLTNKAMYTKYNHIYKQLILEKLKHEIEYNKLLITDYDNTVVRIKHMMMSTVEILFGQYTNNNFIYLFCTKYINIDDELDITNKTELYEAIVEYIYKKESIKSYKSLIDVLYNKELLQKHIDDEECVHLLNKYFTVNRLSFGNSKKSKNNNFPLSNLITIDFMYSLKKLRFNGEELVDIMSLLNIKKIKKDTRSILNSNGMDWETTLNKLDLEIKLVKDNYDRNVSDYKFYMKSCNNIKIVKHYIELSDLTDSNNKEITYDIEFDTLLDDLVILFNILKNNINDKVYVTHIRDLDDFDDITDKYKQALHYNYIYLNELEINSKFNKIYAILTDDVEDESNSDKEYFKMIQLVKNIKKTTIENRGELREINKDRFSYKIDNTDIALLETRDNKYLFQRINKHWISIDKTSYGNITKCFNYVNSVLMIKFDQLDTICSLKQSDVLDKPGDEDGEFKCVRFGEHIIPEKLYKLHLYISKLESKRDKSAKIIIFLSKIDRLLVVTRKKIEDKIKIVGRINNRTNGLFNYKNITNQNALKLPSKKVQMIYNSIFTESDFDYRMEKLFKFIDEYGIDYNTHLKSWEFGGYSESSLNIYYDSPTIEVPLCCKHYLMYKPALYSDNSIRTKQLVLLKNKWGKKEAEFIICTNCGEPIDYIKYSEFEGFGKDNKVINVREAVANDYDVDDIDITNTYSQSIGFILSTLQSILKIKLTTRDYNFIANSVFEDRKEILNVASFYTLLKKGDFTKLVDRTFNKGKIINRETREPFNRAMFDNLFDKTERDFKTSYPHMGIRKRSKPPYIDFKNNIMRYFKINKGKVEAILVREFFGKQIRPMYTNYYNKELIEIVFAYFSQIMIYSLPIYRLVSTGADRAERSGIVIENLYDNKMFAITNLISKIKGENKNNNIGDIVSGYITYYKGIGGESDENSISSINTKIAAISNKPYLTELINKREDYEIFNMEDISTNDYSWGTFLPYLTINVDYMYEIPPFQLLISQYISNVIDVTDTGDSEIKTAKTLENLTVIAKVKNIYNNISTLYGSKINKIISKIDGQPYKLSSYTASIDFNKLSKNYFETLTLNGDNQELISISNHFNTLNKFLTMYDVEKSTNIWFTNNNIKPRILQKYMHFDAELYDDDDDKIREYLIKKLKQINSIIVLDGPFQYQKRYFKSMKDIDYALLTDIYRDLVVEDTHKNIPPESDFIKDKLRELLVEKYGENVSIDFKVNLICENKGVGMFDMTTKKYKVEVDKYMESFKNKTISELRHKLNTLNTTFNNKSIITKNKWSQVEQLNYSDRSLAIVSHLKDFVVNFYKIYTPSNFNLKCDKSELYVKFNDLQEKFSVQKFKFNDYTDLSDVNKEIFAGMDDCLGDGANILVNFKQKLDTRDDVVVVDSMFNNIFKLTDESIMDKYFIELIDSIKQDLKIEDILDEETIETETRFRTNRIMGSKYNTLVQFYINLLNGLLHKTIVYNKLYIPDEHIKLNDANLFSMSLDADLRKHIQDILKPKIKELYEILTVLKDSDEYLDLNISYTNIYVFMNNLNSLNNVLNSKGEIVTVNILKPDIVINILQDIIIRILKSVMALNNEHYDNLLVQFYKNTTVLIKNFVNLSDKDIFSSIKLKRAKENLNRKTRFDKMSEELKQTQKLYRRFNLGNIFDLDDDIELNVFNGENMAEGGPLDDINFDTHGVIGQGEENEALGLTTNYNQDN